MKPATRTLPHKVYRCFDADGRLIYVGMTSLAIEQRFRVHRAKNPQVATDTARVEIAHYRSRSEAAEAESRAIDTERPLYNIRRGAPWEPTKDDLRAAADMVFGSRS
jgi:excinuclease UvrABC nuclease subunit